MTNELKAKHTPGPWNVYSKHADYNHYSLWDKDDNYHQDESQEVREANARLIAAAPDLLDALKHALGDVKARLYVMPADVTDIERAILNAQIVRYESAIMKAEGR